jgi:hypothetical protein
VTEADIEGCRKVFDDDLAGNIGIDARYEPMRLPRRETAAWYLSSDEVADLPGNCGHRISIQ